MKLAYRISLAGILMVLALGGLSACGGGNSGAAGNSGSIDALWTAEAAGNETPAPQSEAGEVPSLPGDWRPPVGPVLTPDRSLSLLGTPTPDASHPLPPLRTQPLQVTVQSGETLREIARRYQVSLAQLIEANKIHNPDLLSVGQALQVPLPAPVGDAPAYKIIPDSEFISSPASVGWDTAAFLEAQGGPLAQASFDGKSAAQVVEEVSRHYSINPRLLLAMLDYQYGWLGSDREGRLSLPKPADRTQPEQINLEARLVENTAAGLSLGYYLWQAGGVRLYTLQDGTVLNASPLVNAGTAALQGYFAEFSDRAAWEKVVGPQGFAATFSALFGSPFDYAVDPLRPPGLTQPALQLPFENDAAWSFTGGPHGGWSSFTAWAALDFAPSSDQTGCVPSDAWVVAMADGRIVYAADGEVIQDLDGDDYWQTGWSLLYMHIGNDERVPAGAFLKAGERIGHPSCEGGVSTGTHLHVARRYNGEWIPADADLPFQLDGWVSAGTGVEYDGTLTRSSEMITAFGGRAADNEIHR